ncbi:MAG: CoA transferase [Thermodesulfobacteriota bacterium]|nr:CoA transferase [Thermodesulfobacteriota bacterium]
MMTEETTEAKALNDLRVLDLADEKGLYCAKIFADMGADVIKVEKPGGDSTRDIPPFYQDIPHRERSLYFWQYNNDKKSITLNLEVTEGQQIFKTLVKTADIIIETYPPGYLDSLNLGYEALKKINPALIITSITPFGQTGPYKDYKASDIVGVAMGGLMSTCGYPDGPPIMPYGGQGYHIVANHAAIATLIALYHKDATGSGQHIDVSMQTAIAQSLEFANIFYLYNKDQVLKRQASRHGSSGIAPDPDRIIGSVIPCMDGFVCTFAHLGPLDWMVADGVAGELQDDPRWQEDPLFRRIPENERYVDERQRAFAMLHTKQEITDGCQADHVCWAKCNTLSDLFSDEHLKSRNWFVEIAHPELGATFKYPGAPYLHQKTPWKAHTRAPLIGEHNLEIYHNELGISKEQLTILCAAGVI